MYVLAITTAPMDTNSQDVPFIPSYTIGVFNGTDAAISLQDSDSDSGFAELAQIPANGMKQVTLRKRYLRGSASGLYAFGT